MSSADSSCEDTLLALEGITKSLGGREVLSNITLSVRRGEFMCVLGPSGCGKSTLLRLIAGLEIPDSGTVCMNGQHITNLPPEQRRMGMMFQNYALFPNLTVQDNIAYGLHALSREERRQRVAAMMQCTGLENYGHLFPAQLSGGQQQRVALARALAPSPKLLLLDEPLSALDAAVRNTLGEILRRNISMLQLTGIMVTHDQREALLLADTVVVLREGRLEQAGTPHELYRHPATRFVAEFVGTMNCLPAIFGGGGVRPEALGLAAPTEALLNRKDTWLAKVESCRPWGSRARLSLLMGDRQTRLCAEIAAEILPEILQNAPLAAGEFVAVTIPEQHRYRWSVGDDGAE